MDIESKSCLLRLQYKHGFNKCSWYPAETLGRRFESLDFKIKTLASAVREHIKTKENKNLHTELKRISIDPLKCARHKGAAKENTVANALSFCSSPKRAQVAQVASLTLR